MRKLSVLILLVFGASALAHAQSISILEGSSFHKAVVGQEYGVLEETATPDLGGVLYVFVQNNDIVADGIDSITVYSEAGEVSIPDGWLVWPPMMNEANGNISTVTIKGIGTPLTEGEAVSVVVHTTNGASDSIFIPTLETPGLRIANAIPSQDWESLFLYLRNDGEDDVTLMELWINEGNVPLFAGVTSYSNEFTLAPGEMSILRVDAGPDLSPSFPLALRLRHQVGSNIMEPHKWVSAGIRLVPPTAPIGSWHSSGLDPENEEGRKRLRRIGVEMLQGIGNPTFMADGFQRYHIRTVREPYFGDPFDVNVAIPEIQALSEEPFVEVWTVDDEPDLNGKPIDEQLLRAEAYRQNDPNTATHVNLAVQKKYQRYGYYTDIVSMDHYAAPSAPNVIPLTNVPIVGRMSEPKEALEYSDVLKWNTEPRRNWSWVQLAASTWDVQANPAAINYQFWAHFAAGAKGLKYFVAQSQTADDFPEQWEEGVTCFKEWKQIRNLCLYGEPVLTGTVTSNEDALARTLVGPEGMVVIVLNNSMRFTGNSLTGFNTELDLVQYNVEFDVPSWLTGVSAYLITDSTKIPVYMHQLVSGRVRIHAPYPGLLDRSHVFIIAPADTKAPNAIEGLNVAEYIDSANYTFSWKEPWDNVGVQGYNVYFNNVLVDRTHAPIYEVKEQALACSGYWKFAAYDNSGNIGPADSVMLVLSGGEAPVIVEQPSAPIDYWVVWNDETIQLSIEVNGVVGYQWQIMQPWSENWVDLFDSELVSGANNSTVTLDFFVNEFWGMARYRCIVSDPCGDSIESDIVEIEIEQPEGVNESSLVPHLYPNPTQDGRFTILMPEHLRSGELTIHSTLGQLVHRSAVSGQQSHITLNLPVSSGLYTVRIVSEDRLWQGKVAVSK